MKKLMIRVLLSAMAVFVFSLFSTGFAGQTDYKLNGKGDGLDVVLNSIDGQFEWEFLDRICGTGLFESNGNSKMNFGNVDYVRFFNKEIRSNYGCTLINLFRDTEYNPGYGRILRGVADKLGIDVPDELTVSDIEPVEIAVIGKVIEKIHDNVLQRDGGNEKWDKIENDALAHVDELFNQGKISAKDYSSVKKLGVAGFINTVGRRELVGSLSELAVYFFANSIWAAAVSSFPLEFLFSKTVYLYFVCPNSFCSAISAIFAFFDTNLEKTISSVFIVAMKRMEQKYGKLNT